MKSDAHASGGSTAVGRALAVLRAFETRDAWALTELAHELDLHKTTTLRLLRALEQSEFVTREADAGDYRLGPGILTLAARALRAMDLYRAARAELASLAAVSGETTTLEVLVGHEVLILDQVHGGHLVGSAPEIGTRWPAHATPTGKVMLAASRNSEGRAHRRRRLERGTPNTIASADRLARELALVARRGYAVSRGEIEPGFTAVGAAVRNHEDRVVAAISACGPSARLRAARIPAVAAQVRRAADRISHRLGAPLRPAAHPSHTR